MEQGVRLDHKATNGAFSVDCFGVQMVVVVGAHALGHPIWVWVIYFPTRNVIWSIWLVTHGMHSAALIADDDTTKGVFQLQIALVSSAMVGDGG